MSDISKINPNGTEYNLKDATARAGIESSKTLKSSVVTVTDAAPINAEDITVDITPIQDLHGYDRPWAGGAWKNKLSITLENLKARNTGGTWSGNVYTRYNATVTVNVDNGGNVRSLTINGTPNQDFNFVYDINTPLLDESLSYILSGCPTGGSVSTYYQEYSNFTDRGYADTGEGVSLQEFEHTYQYRVAQVTIRSGYNAQNLTFYPMIRLATETDPTFAPYSNICPIEGWTGAELDRVGKNKLPMTVAGIKAANRDGTWSGNTYTINNGTVEILVDSGNNVIGLKVNGTFSANTFFSLFGLQEYATNNYILTGINISHTQTELQLYYRDLTNSQDVNPRDSGEGATIRLQSGRQYTGYLRISYGYTASSKIIYPMIRLSTETDPTFAPYQGRQYTASFGETVYGGKWHVTAGGTDKTHASVVYSSVDGTGAGGTFTFNRPQNMNADVSDAEVAHLISDKLKAYSISTVVFGGTIGIAVSRTSGAIYARFPSSYGTTTSDINAKLAVNPLQVCYELATPTTISTPKQNVPMLKGINTVYADCGDTSLEYQPDNVIGELKGEIRAVEAELAEVEENLEIVYEDHVANTSMGIIVDGYSVGDMPFSNALDIAKTGYTPIAVTDTSIVHSTVANQGEIATHCLLDVTNNRVRFYVHVMDSAASLTIPPNSLTFRVAYKKA